MVETTIAFELVSPEKLLLSEPVQMVVVPGGLGDFGVMSGHAPMISTVRPGTICVFEGGQVLSRIFVNGGFAEVTPERCTVLAEEAVPLDELDQGELEQQVRNLGEDLEDAKDEQARAHIEAQLTTTRAMLDAVAAPAYQ